MKTSDAFLSVFGLLIAIVGSSQTFGSTFTTLDYPGAELTIATGIDGSTVCGSYTVNYGLHGFIYDGSTFRSIDAPGLPSLEPAGVWGGTVVGNYYDYTRHGFIY